MYQNISNSIAKTRRMSRQVNRAMSDPAYADQRQEKEEALVKISKWLQANRERAARLVGESQFKADWQRLHGDHNTPDPIKTWQRIQEYDRFLASLEEAEGVVGCQMKIIQDDIELALEQGDTQKAHNLRRLFADYVQRPELAGV